MATQKEENLLGRVREGRKTVARDKKHLVQLIKYRINKRGPNCDLNDIDVSKITDMSKLFYYLEDFNGDIFQWDDSNVTDMYNMFKGSPLEGNEPDWFDNYR